MRQGEIAYWSETEFRNIGPGLMIINQSTAIFPIPLFVSLLLSLTPARYLGYRKQPLASMFSNARGVVVAGNTSLNHYGNNYISGNTLDEGVCAVIRADRYEEPLIVLIQRHQIATWSCGKRRNAQLGGTLRRPYLP